MGFTSSEVLIPLIAGLTLIIGFTAWALPRAGTLINLRLFRHRALSLCSGLGFLAGATLYGAMLLLPLYWQQVRGEDALGAGLLLIPQGVGAFVTRTRAGDYTDRIGPRWVAFAGFALATAATAPFALATADSNEVLLMAALFVRGLGMGMAMVPLTGAAYFGLEHQGIPDASIITRVAQQVGGSVGTAVLAVILQRTISGARDLAAVAAGFGDAFWWSVAFTAVAVPLCLLLPGRPVRPEPTDPANAEAVVQS